MSNTRTTTAGRLSLGSLKRNSARGLAAVTMVAAATAGLAGTALAHTNADAPSRHERHVAHLEHVRHTEHVRHVEHLRHVAHLNHIANQDVAAAGVGNTAPTTTTAATATAATTAAGSDYVLPIEGSYTLTASFAQAGSNWANTHSGQDFAVPTGTPIHTVTSGEVVFAGWDDSYGNNVIIQGEDGKYILYGHLNSLGASVGQQVSAGDVIGLSGSTGNSTGPHLHFEVRTTPTYGSAVDPVAYLASHGVTV
ncbi:M23 family metallopeptidase [Allostreptomyces psammosilenae]|uniref:Murein DD-endopeptidase MepM/ murein hydrolase activator NlpD n=1 Tax=Allostreptomyces psammosilenae TaxID=1892865 RepID=A0A853A1G0_9ACTN|nr:M23 family metallopeptidase [Allostreptomyces psammosilenae]NYI07977.1 murein DD-endopeptidase MepM/ murein hydrolase activator NlpD [Allostreptomyces psammosilenae]